MFKITRNMLAPTLQEAPELLESALETSAQTNEQLAQRIGVTYPKLRKMLEVLLRLGLITCTYEPQYKTKGRIVRHIHVTEKGKEFVRYVND